MKRRILAILLSAAFAVSAVACGNTNQAADKSKTVSTADKDTKSDANKGAGTEADGKGGSEGNAASGGGVKATSANTYASDLAGSVERDVINVGISVDPSDFGPWTAQNAGRDALNGVYECLGYMIDGEFYGVIAKDYQMADDGLSATFEIYDYIYDSAGNHITADDVVFSWETGTAMGYINNVAYVETFEKVDDYTIKMTFNRTLSVGEIDTFWQWFVVSQKAYEDSADGMSSQPVATGPYVMTDYVANYKFTYEKRDDYWQKPELTHARNAANAKKINYYIITESAQRTMALQSGTIDICGDISNDDIEMFMDGGKYADQYNVYTGISNLSSQLWCNMDKSSLCSDVNLRRAIFYAVDIDTILTSVYNGHGVALHDIAPQWSTGYIDKWDTQENYYQYDPQKAKEYLEQSDYNGETLKILCDGSDNIPTLVQAFLLQVGIKSEIETVDGTVLTSYRSEPKNWDILSILYATNIYAADGNSMVLNAGNFEWGGTINFAYDDKLQELLLAANNLNTTSEETLNDLHDYVIDHAVGMGLVNFQSYVVVSSDIDQVTISFKNSVLPGGCSYLK